MRPPLSKAAAAEMREFFGRYGSFIQLWQTYELMIEIAIMRQLRISVEENSIVCGGLNYSAKSAIILGLLKRDGTKANAVSALRTAQQTSERNNFIHSFLTHSRVEPLMRLVRRSVRDGNYKVEWRDATKGGMQAHGDEFAAAFQRAADALDISESDIDAYASELEAHAQRT
jgi:hypothetical protein